MSVATNRYACNQNSCVQQKKIRFREKTVIIVKDRSTKNINTNKTKFYGILCGIQQQQQKSNGKVFNAHSFFPHVIPHEPNHDETHTTTLLSQEG